MKPTTSQHKAAQTVTILTEAGDGVGYGHLSRMQALAQAFYELGISATIIVYSQSPMPTSTNGEYIEIHDNWQTIQKVGDYAKNTDITIVDSYSATSEIYKEISVNTGLAVFVDDLDKQDYPNGLIIKPKILRKSFWNVKKYTAAQNVSSILITIGGLDKHNTMPRLITNARFTYPDANIKIIVSKSFSNIPDIKLAMDSNMEMLISLDAQKMKEFMCSADLAISGGGQTLNELCACGIPSIIVCMADNQKNNIADFATKEAVLYVCEAIDDKLDEKIKEALLSLHDKANRDRLSVFAQNASQADGALLLAKQLMDAYESDKN